MFNRELRVVVKCGYQEIADVEDPQLCAAVMALLAGHASAQPPTIEQLRLRDAKKELEAEQGRTYDWKSRAEKSEKKVAELSAQLAQLQASVQQPKPKEE